MCNHYEVPPAPGIEHVPPPRDAETEPSVGKLKAVALRVGTQ
jgi:hypothetical protein